MNEKEIEAALAEERRMDANESLMFEDDLVVMIDKVYQRKYPDLIGRSLIASAPFTIPEGARKYRMRVMDGVGTWNVIHGYGQELPRVDLFASETEGHIRRIGNSFGFNMDEVEEWRFAGAGSLDQTKANLARDVIEEAIDYTIFFGLEGHGIPGLLNHPNVSASTVATATGGEITWEDKLAADPSLIFADIREAIETTATLTKETANLNTLLLPPAIMRLLAETPLNNYQTTTVLQEIYRRFPSITRIVPVRYLATAGAGGTARFVLFDNNPDYVYYVLPQGFRVHETWHSGPFQWVVPCTAKVGGVNVLLPLEMVYRDGI